MRRISTALLVSLVLVAGSVIAQQKRPQDIALQAAMRTETVDGDLNGAIKQYGAIVDKYKADRAVTATALVHMAGCYQKLGNAEAAKIYERVVREFADQKDAATIARTRLGRSERAQRQGGKAFRMAWSVGLGKAGGNISQDGRHLSYYDGCNVALHDLVDGTNRLLTSQASPAEWECTDWLAISRDGTQVAYNWYNAQTTPHELRLASLQGTGIPSSRSLYAGEDLNYIGPNDWSPDGKWIAVTAERKDRTTHLGIVGVQDGSLRILNSTGWQTWYTAFFSPDGRFLAFDVPASDTSDQRDVFVTDAEGKRQIPAAVHPADDRVMGWSPDGKYLLFSSDRRVSTDLWALPVSEGAPKGTPALMHSNIGNRRSLGVTSAGTLYLQVDGANERDIQTAPLDLDAGKLLGPPVGFAQGFAEGARNPTWSPDRNHLAYPVDCNNGCIAIRSVATGQLRRLAAALTESRAASWSPDGRSLLMKSRDVRGRNGIFRIDVQSGEATPVILSDGLGAGAQWSPDGKKVYFNREGVFVERDLASGAERDVNREVGERFGVLSPDGQYFAVARTDRSTNAASLLLVPVAGGQPRELLRLSQSEALFRPGMGAWTPDSSALIIQKHTGSRWELWLVPVTGGRPRKLDIDPDIWRDGTARGGPGIQGGDAGFSLSPDGRSIALVMGKGNAAAEVWALENFLPAPSAKK